MKYLDNNARKQHFNRFTENKGYEELKQKIKKQIYQIN